MNRAGIENKMRSKAKKIILCVGVLILTLSCLSCQAAKGVQELSQENAVSTVPQADSAENRAVEKPRAAVGTASGISIKVSMYFLPRKSFLTRSQAIGSPAIKSIIVTIVAITNETFKVSMTISHGFSLPALRIISDSQESM